MSVKERIAGALSEFASVLASTHGLASVGDDLEAFAEANALELEGARADWSAGFRHERDAKDKQKAARKYTCPECSAVRGERCLAGGRFSESVHVGRLAKVPDAP